MSPLCACKCQVPVHRAQDHTVQMQADVAPRFCMQPRHTDMGRRFCTAAGFWRKTDLLERNCRAPERRPSIFTVNQTQKFRSEAVGHQQDESFDPPESSKNSSLLRSNGVPQVSNEVAWPAEYCIPRFTLYHLNRSGLIPRAAPLAFWVLGVYGRGGWTGMKPEVGHFRLTAVKHSKRRTNTPKCKMPQGFRYKIREPELPAREKFHRSPAGQLPAQPRPLGGSKKYIHLRVL